MKINTQRQNTPNSLNGPNLHTQKHANRFAIGIINSNIGIFMHGINSNTIIMYIIISKA
jgi:hypothetical protein